MVMVSEKCRWMLTLSGLLQQNVIVIQGYREAGGQNKPRALDLEAE